MIENGSDVDRKVPIKFVNKETSTMIKKILVKIATVETMIQKFALKCQLWPTSTYKEALLTVVAHCA